MLEKLRPYMMPFTMLTGGLFYPFFNMLSPLTPFLIFAMLFISFCKLPLGSIRLSPLHGLLLLIQLAGGLTVFLLLQPFDKRIAQAAMICLLAPTATSAPVITEMLRGDTASLTAYSLLSNISVAVLVPLIFPIIGDSNSRLGFLASFSTIAGRIFPLLLFPLALAAILQRMKAKLITRIQQYSKLSFYLWNCALAIVTGRSVAFIVEQKSDTYSTELIMAGCSLILCLLQFLIGRRLGRRYGDSVAAGQALGQKNTILAIWMTQSYLNPLASIGPGAYVLWQNMVNSFQLWRERKRDRN